MRKRTLLFIFGTRPEAIKLAPVINEFQNNASFSVKVCVTGQHKEMLHQVLSFFNVVPDYDLGVMKHDQSLCELFAGVLKALEGVLEKCEPDMVFVQGDTTTALAGSLACFYMKKPVAHIEAGLRSNNRMSPFPEEMNRVLVAGIADYHFAPTQRAKSNLVSEGIAGEKIFVVGNTVIDALVLGRKIIEEEGDQPFRSHFDFIDLSRRVILVTGHRRESFGEGLEAICRALRIIAEKYKTTQIVYPVHLNPNVSGPVQRMLGGVENIFLVEPLDYPCLIWLMEHSYLVLTDSGGIQEEAPSVGKPVLVMREVTERTEGIAAGTARLVGTGTDSIVMSTIELLENEDLYTAMARAVNPYGNGTASVQIVKIVSGLI